MRLSPFGRTSSRLFFALITAAAGVACSLSLGDEADYFGTDGGQTNNGDATTGDANANDSGGKDSGPTDGGLVDPIPDGGYDPATLVTYLSFDNDTSSNTATDSSGHNRDGILMGDTLPIWDTGVKQRGMVFDDTKHQYIQLPQGLLVGLSSMSVASWLYLTKSQIWDRLFDFNSGTTKWVYFSPTGWNFDAGKAGTHFAISSGATLDPEMQLLDTFPVSAWHHVAVVLAPPYLLYYVDGVEKARRTDMTVAPGDLGSTAQNWIGRSTFTGDAGTDPYLAGKIDEFRLYSGALTATEVAALAAR